MSFSIGDIRRPRGLKNKGKRKGRGMGSGRGKTSGKGHKGAKARSGGGNLMVGFEGGQMTIIRRIPKRGFNNKFRTKWNIINVGKLEELDAVKSGAVVDMDFLVKNGVIKVKKNPLKVLGNGELKKSITVKAAAFTAGAKEAIEKAGGKTEVVK